MENHLNPHVARSVKIIQKGLKNPRDISEAAALSYAFIFNTELENKKKKSDANETIPVNDTERDLFTQDDDFDNWEWFNGLER